MAEVVSHMANGIWETTRHNRHNGLLPAPTCYGLIVYVVDLLQTRYVETGVMNFGLSQNVVHFHLNERSHRPILLRLTFCVNNENYFVGNKKNNQITLTDLNQCCKNCSHRSSVYNREFSQHTYIVLFISV